MKRRPGSSNTKAGGAVSRQRNAMRRRRKQTHLWLRQQALSLHRPSIEGSSGSGRHTTGRAKSFRTKGGSPWHGSPSWANHSLQCLLLPLGGVDRAQPTAAGGDKPRNSEVPGAMDIGGRFQHGARDFWATRRSCETARSFGQASSTHLQARSIGPML